MGLRQRWRRCREEWKKHREEEARLHDLHAALLKALGDRFLPLGGRVCVVPARVETVTFALWRENARSAPPVAAREIAAIFTETRMESGSDAVDYAFLRPEDGTFILEAHLPRGTVYFRFRE